MSTGVISGNCQSISIVGVSITPTSVTSVTAPAQTFTVPGVKAGDSVLVVPPSQLAGVTIGSAYGSAANTVSVQFVNPTAGNLVPPAGTYLFVVLRMEGISPLTAVSP